MAWRTFAVGWTLLIAALTLRSHPLAVEEVARSHWYCVVCGEAGAADVILNLLLFFPLGLALRALDWPWWRAALVMTAFTIGIETTQAHLLIGRDGTLGDVLTNSIGGLLGWTALPLLQAIAQPTRRTARIGTAVILVWMASLWSGSVVALQPAATKAAPWIGQQLEPSPGARPFSGQLHAASVDGIPIPEDLSPAFPSGTTR